jgi:phosphoserine aminotransferase
LEAQAMKRVYNFSAGPSALPLEVLEKAQQEMASYGDAGMSVMEMSHRSPAYQAIIDSAEALFRELMNIPDNYKVLFMQGGASLQFACVPMNLMTKNRKADFVKTGQWAKKAISEAKMYGEVNVLASSEDKTFSYIPELDRSAFSKDADYFYICQNNTIYGTAFKTLPEPDAGIPLIADVSSMILSQEMDVSKYGLLFAGAQKNIGPAGVCVVIVREDLIGHHDPKTPSLMRYDIAAENGSMYNTPPTYAIYICKLVLENLKRMGGIPAIQKINEEKAALLYGYLDSSSMFLPTVMGDSRSLMNVPFVTGSDDLDKKFVKEAEAAGFVNLKGHRSVGGMRASIYNAVSLQAVEDLVAFMKAFEANN